MSATVKRLLAVGTGVAFLVLPAPPAAFGEVSGYSAETLLNGGFEGSNGWENHYDGPDPSGISAARSHQGSRSLWISDSSESVAEGWRSKAIRVIGGTRYTLSSQVNIDTGQAPYLYLKFHDADGSEVASYSASASGAYDNWTNVEVTGRAPSGAAVARAVVYSSIGRVTESYFDAVVFRPGEGQSLVGNQDFELDTLHAAMPLHWYHATTASQPVSVELDQDSTENQVLEIVDTSTAAGTAAATRFIAATGAAYQVALDLRRSSGTDAVLVYVRYYDEEGFRLSSRAESADTSADMWETYSTRTYAPHGAAVGEIVVACISNRRCETTVDNVTSTQVFDQTRYAAASIAGTGDGSTPANAASYADVSFWSAVDSALDHDTVKVVLLDGTYHVDDSAKRLALEDIGSNTRRLTIAGESPYGVVFSLDADISGAMILLGSVENITFTDFHITSSGDYRTSSTLLISAGFGETTRDVELRHFSIVDVPGAVYSGVGLSAAAIERAVFDVSIQGGTFARNGKDGAFHHIYVTKGASFTDISSNYFEDSSGTYIKLRDVLDGVDVTGNIFYATGSWHSNVSFVQLAVYNDVNPGDEWFGGGYRFVDNRFVHINSWCDPRCTVFNITHQGYNPVDDQSVERDHLLSPGKRDELLDASPSNTADRSAILEDSFFLKPNDCSGICISNTTSYGDDVRFQIWTKENYGAHSQGGSGLYDISNLFNY